MFRKMTLGKKLACGFGVVLAALALIVVLSFIGVGGIVTNAKEVIYGNQLDAVMTQKEVDHLNWVSKVNQLLTNDKVTEYEESTQAAQNVTDGKIGRQRKTTGTNAQKGTLQGLPHAKKCIEVLLIFLTSTAKLVVISPKPVTYNYAYG